MFLLLDSFFGYRVHGRWRSFTALRVDADYRPVTTELGQTRRPL